jgi:hypothetical protein
MYRQLEPRRDSNKLEKRSRFEKDMAHTFESVNAISTQNHAQRFVEVNRGNGAFCCRGGPQPRDAVSGDWPSQSDSSRRRPRRPRRQEKTRPFHES